MGARRSTDVVEKATWILAVVLISFSLLSNFFRPTSVDTETNVPASRLNDKIEEAQVPSTTPGAAPQPEMAQPADTNP
jgi:preprotein translocase subunit SecG